MQRKVLRCQTHCNTALRTCLRSCKLYQDRLQRLADSTNCDCKRMTDLSCFMTPVDYLCKINEFCYDQFVPLCSALTFPFSLTISAIFIGRSIADLIAAVEWRRTRMTGVQRRLPAPLRLYNYLLLLLWLLRLRLPLMAFVNDH